MKEQQEGDACPAYVNQDRNAVAENVLPTAVPTILELKTARDLVAYRAMGVLIAMYQNGNLPTVHRPHVKELIDEHGRLTAELIKAFS